MQVFNSPTELWNCNKPTFTLDGFLSDLTQGSQGAGCVRILTNNAQHGTGGNVVESCVGHTRVGPTIVVPYISHHQVVFVHSEPVKRTGSEQLKRTPDHRWRMLAFLAWKKLCEFETERERTNICGSLEQKSKKYVSLRSRWKLEDN